MQGQFHPKKRRKIKIVKKYMKTYKFRNKNKTIKGGKFSDWKLQLEGDNFKSYTNDKYVI